MCSLAITILFIALPAMGTVLELVSLLLLLVEATIMMMITSYKQKEILNQTKDQNTSAIIYLKKTSYESKRHVICSTVMTVIMAPMFLVPALYLPMLSLLLLLTLGYCVYHFATALREKDNESKCLKILSMVVC